MATKPISVSRLAVTSLVLGGAAMTIALTIGGSIAPVGLFLAAAAIVLGVIGGTNAERNRQGGLWLASAGLVSGGVAAAIIAMGLVS